MRAFLVACVAAIVIAVGAAAVLDHFILTSSVGFTEPTARI
jgi:hypothetical protein